MDGVRYAVIIPPQFLDRDPTLDREILLMNRVIRHIDVCDTFDKFNSGTRTVGSLRHFFHF